MSRSRRPIIRLKPLLLPPVAAALLLLLLACHCQQLFAALPPPPTATTPTQSYTASRMVAATTTSWLTKVAPEQGGDNVTLLDDLETTVASTTLQTKLPDTKRRPIDLTVGYLTAVKGDVKDRQGLAVSGALTLAIKEVNDDPSLLPDVRLVLKWNDTKGDTVLTTRAMTDMICEGVAAFFGPEASCYVEAIISQSRNIPMISYKCSDPKASEVPTFARTDPPDTQVTKSLISLLKYYNWYKFSIITETDWMIVAKTLRKEAIANKLTVNHFNEVVDRHACCVNGLTCCANGYWYELIRETRNGTRIYVFFGSRRALIEMMATMQVFGLFENGEYMVIYVDQNTYSVKDAVHYLWQPEQWSAITSRPGTCEDSKDFYKRARSLLVIVLSPPNEDYIHFTDKVRDFNQREPFNFTFPSIFLNVSTFLYMRLTSTIR
ncbi:hypothetical protein LSTR_LSTR000352 [Laodelphax striatellus]|uniref:Receptor ligand binding region domain-containing protein n=1 Tax=Laodelphax striatellus TaxID=195883 RepID=A0A482X419_LAOST|nr:hypothetical protein LSTR_LSTR000352 [Laodelphax striatellus]